MTAKYILVPTDFTKTADHALAHAANIAKKSGDRICLLHIHNSHSEKLLKDAGHGGVSLEEYMKSVASQVEKDWGVNCVVKIEEGSITTDINRVALDPEMKMMVIATHGTKGLWQNLFGSDMLKIASKAPIPVLIVPDGFEPRPTYERIVFPFGSHDKYQNKVDAVGFLAGLFGCEVEIYSADKAGTQLSKKTIENVEEAESKFDEKGVKYKVVHEESEGFSIGYAKQTLKHAESVKADIVAVMSVASTEHEHISDSDKERLINNQSGIGILMTSDF